MRLIFATHNAGKVKEMKAILAGLDFDLVTAEEAGVTEEPVEDGATFEANALIKAKFVAEQTGQWSVADDSGICIDALDGRPGVLTARWAGDGAAADEIVAFTLKQLLAVPEGRRQASFVSCAAIVAPDGQSWTFRGEIRGHLPLVPIGNPVPKLPYDVIFIPDGHNRTFAQMSDAKKNSLSHRGLAFQKLKEFLTTLSFCKKTVDNSCE